MKSNIKEEFYKYLKNPEANDGALISKLEKMRQQWYQFRSNEHDHRWQQNLAFYSGSHYIRDSSKNSNQYKVRLRENHTNNIVNRMVSIFVQNLPITRVFPATSSNDDVQSAKTCEMYAKYFYRVKKLEQKYAQLVKYSAIFGNGFTYRQYDPYAGGVLHLSADENNGKEEEKKWRGDIKLDVADPFKVNVRPGIEEMEDMFDFFYSVPSNKSEIESIYGEVDSEPVAALNAYNGQLRSDDELTMVHHYYHKPTYWWDEGAYICYVGKKILKAMTFPYKDGKLPLEHLPFDKPPMKFWALSEIDQIIDLQEQLNRAASMIIEARNLIAKPRVLASEESKIPGQSFTDRPGDILRYKLAGGRPEFYVPNFNFNELAAHKGDVRNAMQLVSGVTSASRGEIPAATKTALALQLVLEQDRSQWTPFIKQFYQIIQNDMLGILGIAAQYFPEDDPRVVKIEQNNVTGVKTFHGGMVPSPLDIWLEDTNPLGWTAAGRIESIQALVGMGAIKDENRILEMLSLNNTDPAYEFININKQSAQKENELLNNGETLEVMPEDMDPIHLDEHVKEVASFSFRSKPKAVQDAFEYHINLHKQRMGPAPGAQAPQGGLRGGESAAKGLEGMIQQSGPMGQDGSVMNQLLSSARG